MPRLPRLLPLGLALLGACAAVAPRDATDVADLADEPDVVVPAVVLASHAAVPAPVAEAAAPPPAPTCEARITEADLAPPTARQRRYLRSLPRRVVHDRITNVLFLSFPEATESALRERIASSRAPYRRLQAARDAEAHAALRGGGAPRGLLPRRGGAHHDPHPAPPGSGGLLRCVHDRPAARRRRRHPHPGRRRVPDPRGPRGAPSSQRPPRGVRGGPRPAPPPRPRRGPPRDGRRPNGAPARRRGRRRARAPLPRRDRPPGPRPPRGRRDPRGLRRRRRPRRHPGRRAPGPGPHGRPARHRRPLPRREQPLRRAPRRAGGRPGGRPAPHRVARGLRPRPTHLHLPRRRVPDLRPRREPDPAAGLHRLRPRRLAARPRHLVRSARGAPGAGERRRRLPSPRGLPPA
jgi:hypothetical protein